MAAPAIREEVIAITKCVPRELIQLLVAVEDVPDPITLDNLKNWTKDRTDFYLQIAMEYYESRTQLKKRRFYDALFDTFLGSTSTATFDWDFLDLGLIYRSKVVGEIGTQHHSLCGPVQIALQELFKTLPLPEDLRKRICDGTLDGTTLN
ncbi:hypothetical protein BGX34_007602, partial [Mortierella sp. NVP85]